MSLRTTRQASEVLGGLTGPISVTRQMVEALVEGPGSLRTTRQATEVLGTTTGPVNVTRQMVEALVVENSGLLVTRQIYEELLQVGGLARVSRQMCEVLTDTAAASGVWCQQSVRSRLVAGQCFRRSTCGSYQFGCFSQRGQRFTRSESGSDQFDRAWLWSDSSAIGKCRQHFRFC